ncbi:MAG: SURF1 family protein [Saccharospirillaceae bacterium]|nr:SURF1 family protein [Pseudomonadales bacterium]NRB79114.1 SURF1 family protein [Saccharospirillaceae bacterium]
MTIQQGLAGPKKTFKFSLIPFLLTLFVLMLCIRLSYWQIQRADSKKIIIQQITQMENKGLFDLNQLNELDVDLNTSENVNKTGINLQLTGTINNKQYWLLDNSIYQSKVGYDVLVIFNDSNSNKNVLVNLGWVAAGVNRGVLPELNFSKKVIRLKTKIQQQNITSYYLSNNYDESDQWPKRIQSIDLEKITNNIQHKIEPFLLHNQHEIFNIQPHYKAVVMPVSKHYGYALQWLLIGLSACCVYFYASFKISNNKQ